VRLTVYTDFSLRVLMFLALKGDGLATIAEIAKAYGISKNHLMKVAYQLGLAGYVETVRGKGGGMRLARRPQDIVLGEVVRRTEPDMALVPCFAPDDASCVIFPSCAVRFPGRATRSLRRSTSTPWRTLFVRAHRSGNCYPLSQTAGRRDNGLPGGRSHVARARSNSWRTGSQQHCDRIGAASGHVA
jgi:Rrf2 family nitric oxide-sensitive transcriptional repressor